MIAFALRTRSFAAFFALSACAAPAVPGYADAGKGNALALLDAYLAQEAPTTPEYRADLQPGRSSAELPSGRFSGFGPVLGPFTYRPKTYGELSLPARADLLREPKLRAYLSGIRSRPDSPPRGKPFSIGPEEMLSARPVSIALPNP